MYSLTGVREQLAMAMDVLKDLDVPDQTYVAVDTNYDHTEIRAVVSDLEEMEQVRKAFGLPVPWTKEVTDYSFKLKAEEGSLRFIIIVDRTKVCTRVEKQVTRMVPDVTDVPMKEITQTVVEWVCPDSLLEEVKP